MRKSFKGVAYWTVNSSTAQWASKAKDALLPLEGAGLGVIGFDCVPAGDRLMITMGDEKHELLISGGQGRGVVSPSPAAARFVVCLVALRKHLGDIDVVDDDQKLVPTVPRQNYPLFAADWLGVLPVAEALGVVANRQVIAAMRNLIV